LSAGQKYFFFILQRHTSLHNLAPLSSHGRKSKDCLEGDDNPTQMFLTLIKTKLANCYSKSHKSFSNNNSVSMSSLIRNDTCD